VLNCIFRLKKLTAIAERVGRDVDNPHDKRSPAQL
jgi:hypothetical protein